MPELAAAAPPAGQPEESMPAMSFLEHLEELRRRCGHIDNRPLFRDPESFAQLYDQRLPYYQLAEHRVTTDSRAPKEVVEEILRLKVF